MWADRIITTSAGMAHMAPPTTLGELGEMRAGHDCSSAPIPARCIWPRQSGTPCVGLYGPVSAERNGPYGSQHVAVQKICLTGSSRSRRQANDASMRAISVQDVCTASDQLLLAHAEPQIIAAPFGRRESAASAA